MDSRGQSTFKRTVTNTGNTGYRILLTSVNSSIIMGLDAHFQTFGDESAVSSALKGGHRRAKGKLVVTSPTRDSMAALNMRCGEPLLDWPLPSGSERSNMHASNS